MYVIDLEGNEYSLQATSTNVNYLNGNQSFSATILPTKVNKLFIEDIAEMWNVVDHDDVEHKIIYHKKKGEGNSLRVDVKGIPLFFDVLDNDRIYERIDEHMTAQLAFTRIFEDTGFTHVIVDQFSAVDWEGFGDGETKLESFKRALNRYKCEFRIVGRTVYLETQIGRDTSIMYRHRLNASNIVQEVDANEMWTYARGYGDYEDGEDGGWETAKLKREYTSPLADIIGIRHAPPIKNGKIKKNSTMDNDLKTLVDESLKVSVTADVHDLSKQNYPIGQSRVGDRVFLIDGRIGLNEEIRVAHQSITRNWKGDIIDINVNFGSTNLSKRYQSNINTAVKNITDVYAGRKKLELSFLDERVQEISNIINGNTDSVFKYMPNGIVGWNGDDPNYMTRYVGDAIGFSKDGGQTYSTAMSAELGIVADYITTGTLRAILIDGVEIYGSYIEGSTFFSGDSSDYTEISNSKLTARGTFERTWLGDTNTYDIRTILENGYVRFRNDSEESSLYLSWNGISTYVDGDGNIHESNGSSGSIYWWDTDHSPTGQRGITVNSYGGTAALVSEQHHALVKSRYSATIESTESNVQISTHTDHSNTSNFIFTKSADRREGYILYGTNNTKGLRFGYGNSPIVQVVDRDNSTGGNTEIEAGLGRFNYVARRSGNSYISFVTNDTNYFGIGNDSTGRRVASHAIYGRTYDSSPNVHITSEGTLGLSTSSERYKLNVEKQFEDEIEQLRYSENILELNVTKWHSKTDCEILAEEIEQGRRLSADEFQIRRYVGLTSEKVVEVGFPEHVQRDAGGNLQGVEYDRLWIHLIPIVKDLRNRIEELEGKANGQTT